MNKSFLSITLKFLASIQPSRTINFYIVKYGKISKIYLDAKVWTVLLNHYQKVIPHFFVHSENLETFMILIVFLYTCKQSLVAEITDALF